MPEYLKYKRSQLFNGSLQSLKAAKGSDLGRRPHAAPPFEALPVELVIEIFSYCLPELPRFDIDDAPLLLSRVCKSWKHLVLHTPKLWSAFEIEITGSGKDSTATYDKHVMDTMDRWLKRSKSYPLSIRLVHIPVGRVPNQRSSQLVAALIPQARRWRDVQLILPASDVKDLQKSLPIDLPQLQSLAIRLNGTWSSDSALDVSALNIPWHQLTMLDLQLEHNNLLTLDKCLEILSQTENLRHFTVNVNCIMADEHIIVDSISLPTLETLDLVLHGGGIDAPPATHHPESHLTTFLSFLSLPKLTNLRLKWLAKQAPAWSPTHSNFITFLRRVASTLESLSIRYIPLSEQQLMQCMTELPCLRQLDLRFSFSALDEDPITDTFFRECTPRSRFSTSADGRTSSPQTQPMLPLLQSLTLHCYGKWYTHPCLTAFFESRLRTRKAPGRPPTNTLNSFHLYSINPLLPSMEELLRRYRDEGMDIWIDALVVR
ncbi:hypothetical protein BJ912DRAFT_361273 [Pholiota molesta]|nr:hypothetical protein BJ912DRAFT_361273 [Pholiota molesta]